MWYLVGFVVAVAIFVTGFFVGKRHGERFMNAAGKLQDSVGKG